MRRKPPTDLLIVATCSYGKTIVPPSDLEARSLPAGSVDTRVQEWSNRLEAATPRVPARELYKGDHWTAVRGLADVAADVGLRVQMWIASAGYGLISIDAEIASYGATFAPDHEDFVLGRASIKTEGTPADWWSRIAAWAGPEPTRPRTVTALARRHPTTPTLVIASRPYARALMSDLLGTAAALDSQDLLSIVSIGLGTTSPLERFVLPGDARFSTWLGGTLTSVNARVGKAILERVHEWGLTRDMIERGLSARLEELDPYTQPKREVCRDDEVRDYIRTALHANPASAYSRLLRSFRADGYACEQERFRRLFEDVKHGSDIVVRVESS